MKKFGFAANIFFLTLLAALGVNLFYDVIEYQAQAIQAPAARAPAGPSVDMAPAPPGQAPLSFYESIVARDLFQIGKSDELAVAPNPAEGLEITELNIKLWGTVTGNGALKYAVIEAPGERQRRAQQLYCEGDRVQAALIEKILDDKIILSNAGQRQVLQMEKFRLGAGRSVSRRPVSRVRPTYRRTISRSMIERATQNFDQLTSQARIEPVADGMKIASLQSGSILRRLGLRPADVITGVNNRPIRSMQDALNIYSDLQNGGRVSIQLLRRKQAQTIEYVVR